jgi:zona occludens toxin
MPINAFGGGPGSGKTYGVMEHVILPAIAQGRFILTNIEGLQPDAIYQYVAENAPRDKIICIGHIRTCGRNAPEEDDFFPGEEALDKPMPVPATDFPRVSGGDLVVVDEATRYWATGDKIKRTHAYFFREHRHFSNEIGHTCDLVVIDPDLSLLARQLKGKLEMASVTHKPKEIGLNRYVVNIYPRGKVRGTPVQTLGPYAFKKEIYSLYKSYSHEKAKEQVVDNRQNIFANPRLWVMFLIVFFMFVTGGFFTYRFFQPETHKVKTSTTPQSSSVNGSALQAAKNEPTNDFSDKWRYGGSFKSHGETWAVLVDPQGRVRVESPSMITGNGISSFAVIDGKKVTTYSGAQSSNSVFQPTQAASK